MLHNKCIILSNRYYIIKVEIVCVIGYNSKRNLSDCLKITGYLLYNPYVSYRTLIFIRWWNFAIRCNSYAMQVGSQRKQYKKYAIRA